MADTIEIVQGTATVVEVAGPTGPQGPAGSNGAAGSNGEAATITVGTVTTGAAGSSASVTNTGTSSAAVLAFSIPRGDKGDKGDTGATGPAGTTDYNNLTNKPTLGTAAAANIGTGAGDVAEGNHTHTSFSTLRIDPANGNVGSLVVGNTTGGQNDYVTIDSNVRFLSPSNTFKASLSASALSADRTATLPNASGTLALTSDIPTTFAASAITSGTLDTARLGSGAPSSGTWLRGDSTWQALPAAGSTNLWIPASAWIPRTTNGCGVDSREQATNKINTDELLFDAAAIEYAQASVVMPNNWNAGTITAKFYWTASSGSGDVVWQIAGRALANDDALDQAMGTSQTATDTLTATNDMDISPATSAVTLAGSPAAGQLVIYEISRKATDNGDTLAVDARLLGVEISFN